MIAARQRLAEGRAKLKQRHQQGTPGVQVSGALADLWDAIVLDLYQAALADFNLSAGAGPPAELALVAHAGYGRRDVAPFSDVDLMILHRPGAHQHIAPLAARLLQDICDAGLALGQSVRTPAEACRLALNDASICTSLMESRLLTGNTELFERYCQRFQQQLTRHLAQVLNRIEQARAEERLQYGETVYLLEPNVKRSRGGLRDIQLLRWLGYACYGSADPDSLQLRGALSKEDQQLVRQACDFLLRLRNELHFHAGKAYDLLDRCEQVRLAEWLKYEGDDGLLPVEEFMREYFRRTHHVSCVASRFLANHRPGSRSRQFAEFLFGHQVERDFHVGPHDISVTRSGAAKLRQSLTEVLRLCDLANLYDKRISDKTREVIREGVPSFSSDLAPEAAARFLSVLTQPTRLGELLRLLHDLGVLEKIIPDFAHARGLLQFNEYHKYTVDEHSLRALEHATDLFRDSGPLGRVYRHIKQKRLLHLALLLHDLGKGYAEDHSDVGLRIARQIAVRLQLPPHEAESLKFLIHKHLMMSHLAFRRDTSDQQLVLRFAVEVGSPELLEMLYVLTAADLAAVGPGVLNNWKIEVLSDLFHRAMEHLAGHSPTRASTDRMQTRRDEIRACLVDSADTPWFSEQLNALPNAYMYGRSPAQIAADLCELRQLKSGDVIARGSFLPESGTVEYTIGTYEDITPGVFHKLTGALSAKGLQILSAEINPLAHGLVLDRFTVLDPDFAGEPSRDRLQGVSQALVEALQTGATPAFRKLWRSGRSDAGAQLNPLPTQVRIDNNTSDRFTILDIFAADRMGLLYSIARTLFEMGLSVSVAKIGTYYDQVVDVFYVSDQQGQKIHDAARLEQIRLRLLEVVAAQTHDHHAAPTA